MGKKDSMKPKGRMSAYAFFLQVAREDIKQQNPEGRVDFKEFSRGCADRWKRMDDRQKKRFHDMAAADKMRYNGEMKNYRPGPGEKRKRGKKDPNAPKRALSAFFFFCADERPRAKAALNNTNSVAEVSKLLGQRWGAVRPEMKAKYEQMAAKDKERYEREITAYKGSRKGPAKPAAGRPAPVQNGGQDSDDDDEDDEEDDDE